MMTSLDPQWSPSDKQGSGRQHAALGGERPGPTDRAGGATRVGRAGRCDPLSSDAVQNGEADAFRSGNDDGEVVTAPPQDSAHS